MGRVRALLQEAVERLAPACERLVLMRSPGRNGPVLERFGRVWRSSSPSSTSSRIGTARWWSTSMGRPHSPTPGCGTWTDCI